MTLTSRTRLRTEYIRREREGSERDRERPRTSENQATLVSAVNHMAARTFSEREKKKDFFPLNFNVYINLENRERARAIARNK